MIDRDYCVTMARYNTWQNNQLVGSLKGLEESGLHQDRGAFFGSILGTLNHLLWGDMMWMSRFERTETPTGNINDSAQLCPTFSAWTADRFRMDGRMTLWAERLNNIDLKGDLKFYSGVLGRETTKPMGYCVTHFFNHQTHHRGQVHAMLTAAGHDAPVSDLFLMPEDI